MRDTGYVMRDTRYDQSICIDSASLQLCGNKELRNKLFYSYLVKKSIILLSGFLFISFVLGPLLLSGQEKNGNYDETVRKYIERYRNIAIKEMMFYRVPASITLAQGILESNAGTSPLATQANNHFGIKCHKEWTGRTFIQDDETKDECFRKYDTPEESFRDHSYFLTQRDRYKPLFDLDINDYKGWANGLKSAGYATNPQYSEKLVKTIETYGLSIYDVVDFSQVFSDSLRNLMDTATLSRKVRQSVVVLEGPGYRKILTNNGLKFILAQKGDTPAGVAREFALKPNQVLEFNDMVKGAKLVPGQMVYLEKKRKKGAASYHVVKNGETMYTISQKNGIQLKILYKKNKMKPGQPVKPGKKLILR
jgi:LysM repeat protein